MSIISQLFGIWSKLERWKSSKMGVSWTDQRFLKKVDLKCQLLLLYTTTHFLIRLWRAMKSGFYKTTSDEQLSGWTEKFQSTFQSQTSTKKKKKVMVTVWLSAAQLIHYSFLNPCETITSEKYGQQIDEIHWKLKCLHLALLNRKGPILLHHTTWLHVAQPKLQKLNELGYEILSHPPSVQFSSVSQLCPTLWDPMDCNMSGLPVHHQLLEFTQTHVHWVGDAIQPSHPLSYPSPPAFNLSQHQCLFK